MTRLTPALLTGLLSAVLVHGPLAAQDVPPVVPRTGSAVVTGQVIAGDTGHPLPSVSVELIFASDSLPVGSAVTDSEGAFRIRRLPEGVFFVRLTSIGYGSTTTVSFEVADAEVRELRQLVMAVQPVEIEPITVSAERTAVTFEADRTSYNVGVMPGTEGTSVTETLAMIPELEVDIDGQVTLRNSSVTIYIDGREAPMSGQALAMFLEQFPADYVQMVEVMENPSARYDAEGTGGIINIVLKEGVELGLSGSVFANAGSRGEYGLGGRGTMQRGKWTVNGGGFAQLSDSEQTGFDLRQNLNVDPAFLRQNSWSDRSGLTGDLELDVSYEPTEQSEIFVEGRISGSGGDSDGLTTTTHLSDLDSPILAFDRTRSSDSRDVTYDFATGFEWEPDDDEREEELEIEFEAQRGTQWENSREEILEDLDADDVLIPAELTLENEDEIETELTLEVDYARSFGEDTEIEIGYEGERVRTENDRLIREIEDPTGAPDGELENRGNDNWEVSHSAYTTVERNLGPLSIQAGLRGEYMDLRFELPAGERFGREWFNVFPSANVSWRIDDDRQLRLSYSRRVDRPGLSELNPVNTSTDPLERRVGNPEIEPEFTHSVNADLRWSLSQGNVRFSPSYRTTRNGWERITRVDEQGVSTRTYENVASSERYGASLTYSLRGRGTGWGGYLSISATRETWDASNLGDDRYSGSSLRFSSRANVDGRISESLSAQANLRYSPATDLPQGRIDPRYSADFGLRYRMMDDRMSVRLRLRDPFGLEGSSEELRDIDYIILGRSEASTRSAEVSISYALGGGGEYRGRGRWR